jgi:hypothetical protein
MAPTARIVRRSTKRAPSQLLSLVVSAFLCNFLDDHGVKPVKVLKKAGLRHETQADWHLSDAVHALYMASQRFMPQTLHTDSEAASDDDDASDEQPALVDSDSDASSACVFSFSLVGSVQGLFSCFSLSLRFSSGFTRGGLATHNFSLLPGLAFFCNQLAYGRLVIRRVTK